MASVGMTRVQDENSGEPILTSPGGKTTRKRKMEERDENSLGEPEDFEWETSKENVMPLKRGRVVDDLNRALRTQESYQGKMKVTQDAKDMEARVLAYTGSDPLSMWVQYIKWLEANMPEDTRKKFTALEKCTRELKSHDEYKNDIRYVRLWIQYADLVSNPKDIFKFLYVNKIGEHVALFYVGWAMVLESVANYAQAHKVYLKATQKKAQPEDLLDRKYKDFQRRMSRHWLKVSTSDGSEASIDGNQRFALEDISTDGVDIQRLGNSDNFRRYAQAQAEKMQQANAHKPVFTVYEDPAGAEVDTLPTGTDWKRLDTVENQNKENDTAPTRWNDAPLRPHTSDIPPVVERTTHPAAEAIQVFVDPEFVTTHTTIGTRDRSLTLRQRLDGVSTEEEKLLQQPLKNFTTDAKAEVTKSPRATKSSKAANERCVYDAQLLETKSGEELCFEEVRARQFVAKARKLLANQSSGTGNRFLAQQPTRAPASQQSLTQRPQLKSSSHVNVPQVQTDEPKRTRTAEPVGTLDHAAQEDMTINTRLAVEDVNSMFCSPSRESNEPVVGATVWEVPEPVERKLHFSIFDDSVDSIAVNPNDISLRNENSEQASKNSFQVYTEDLPATQTCKFQVFSDEAGSKPSTAPRTASKVSARKPLTSREDLARRSRLTNKDMILKIQTDTSADDGESSKLRAINNCQRNSVQKPVMRKIEESRVTTIPMQDVVQRSSLPPQANRTSLDPFAPAIRRQMIESAKVKSFAASSPHLVHWHPFKAPSLWTTNQQRRKLKKPVSFHLDEKVTVEAVGFLGSGAFAQVFSVKVEGIDPALKTMALKCEKTANNLLWELYITEKLRKCVKLNSGSGASIPRMSRLDIFKNGTLLLMDKAPAGTLHDLLNAYKKDRRTFPETLAIHYAIQMLYAVESIHEANVLHGDIKPDNWLLVPLNYVGQGRENSSSTGCLRLIDYGRSIDMDFFPAGMTFRGDCHVKGFQTIEMISKRPWTRQIDTFGVCATVHCMLFGEYMEVSKTYRPDGSTRWKPAQALKRYWQVAMWKALFDTFLNVPNCQDQPSLGATRRQFERYFEESPHRREELRELLSSQERMLTKSKL